jgi:hypothetical protein
MIVTTIRPRTDVGYRQSVNIVRQTVLELEYLQSMLSEDNTTAMTEEGKNLVKRISSHLEDCIRSIEVEK